MLIRGSMTGTKLLATLFAPNVDDEFLSALFLAARRPPVAACCNIPPLAILQQSRTVQRLDVPDEDLFNVSLALQLLPLPALGHFVAERADGDEEVTLHAMALPLRM